MGVYIRLELLPGGIVPQEWEQVYEESLLLLKAYPFLDLICDEETHKVIWTYVDRAKERPLQEAGGERGWHVFGDEASLQTGESFELVRNLEYYRSRVPGWNSAQDCDVLTSLMEEEWLELPGAGLGGGVMVFDAKTQGHPYHMYLLAMACLIESRFPRQAVVSGDVTKEQMERAVEWANSILPRSIGISERTEDSRLLDRVRPLVRDELCALKAWMRLSLRERDEGCGVFVRRHFPFPVVADYYLEQFRQYHVGMLGFSSVLREFLNQGGSLEEACRICVLDPTGCRYEAAAFTECVLRLGWQNGPEQEGNNRLSALLEPRMGVPETVYSMLGRVILTMAGVQEPMRCSFSYREVVEILTGELGSWCDVEMLAAKQTELERTRKGNSFLQKVELVLDDLEQESALAYDIDNVEKLIQWTGEERVHPHILDKLHQVSAYLAGAGREECQEELERFRAGDHRKRERMLIARCRAFYIHKHAWDYILALKERPDQLEQVYLLLSVKAEEFTVHHICKALANNSGLLRTFILKEELLH